MDGSLMVSMKSQGLYPVLKSPGLELQDVSLLELRSCRNLYSVLLDLYLLLYSGLLGFLSFICAI